jgi:hypothetical protein
MSVWRSDSDVRGRLTFKKTAFRSSWYRGLLQNHDAGSVRVNNSIFAVFSIGFCCWRGREHLPLSRYISYIMPSYIKTHYAIYSSLINPNYWLHRADQSWLEEYPQILWTECPGVLCPIWSTHPKAVSTPLQTYLVHKHRPIGSQWWLESEIIYAWPHRAD